jgi:hypothetical protein
MCHNKTELRTLFRNQNAQGIEAVSFFCRRQKKIQAESPVSGVLRRKCAQKTRIKMPAVALPCFNVALFCFLVHTQTNGRLD